MNKKIWKLVLGATTLALLLILSGCDSLLQEETDDTGYSGATGTVTGTVRDATTGNGVSGVTVQIVDYDFSATSDDSGDFSITSPTGTHTIRFTSPVYDFDDVTVSVAEGSTTQIDDGQTVGNPELETGAIRIVLTWGSSPSDLDSHLYTPSGQEVYFGNPAPSGAGANLDTDDTSSYGPETITITSGQTGGTYYYWVYNWSGTPDISSSNAVVRLYDSSGLAGTFNIPTTGTGLYWNVMSFTYDGVSVFNVTQANRIQTSDPVP